MKPVRPGVEGFLTEKKWRGPRLGLIAHAASVRPDLTPTALALQRAGFRLTALFAPEHGLAAALQDQAPVQGARDKATGLPLFSLYGKTLAPTPSMLDKIDAMVFDLQDIGVRYYTFVWTLALALEACARAKKPFLVLDRPNPLGGRTDGNLPNPDHLSFVGLHPVPVLHGLTAGELALWLNATRGWGADLRVFPATGWRRNQRFDATGLPWVLPSPNMPTLETASVYGGACLFEATNLSEGRGTTRPFEILGAPFLDGDAWARALARHALPGVAFRPLVFRPTFNKWAGRLCGGVQTHVTDWSAFSPFLTGVALLHTARRLAPRQFRWSPPPYEYERVKRPIDILTGSPAVRRAVDGGASLNDLAAPWAAQRAMFRAAVAPFRLYKSI
ncbi:MAG: DUF1343 domain-containing protein [Elusimicrobia bacterium]|jgi:uncharacterized protein YbbC (DUF1343 family)|nr:DUF1343 domain-containing protein [Elusimicrobiota bacterium]MBK7574973.1 DUF1343 domain-containing protein [Elusimicrobiota bacterium]MBK8125318.1 DUF1343 domain-containing protein [Elusimicrobiota bacterium]MBK8423996.1 DUF1343 domain-containing protein [Elusimicrobiota bacterium]MBK9056728.1 DUF1343 domain-containing protein [Elusimicrobiota bacterium]